MLEGKKTANLGGDWVDYGFEESDFGDWEWECVGCGIFTRVNEQWLCEECAGKLERDLIRQRDWDYSMAAFCMPPEKREELRARVIREYGEELELIVPPESGKKKKKKRKRKSRKKGGRGRG